MKDWEFLTTVEEMEAATNSLLENGKKVGADTWQQRVKNQTPHCGFGEAGYFVPGAETLHRFATRQRLCLVLEIESSQIFTIVHIFVFLTAAKVGHLIASLFWALTNRI